MRVSHKLVSLAGIMVALLIIALVSIGLILQPARIQGQVSSGEEYAQSELIKESLLQGATSWKEYPEYNIGLGSIAILAFTGSILVCGKMYRVRDGENDALQSKSSGV